MSKTKFGTAALFSGALFCYNIFFMAPLEFTQSESASSAVLPHVPESEASVIQTKTLWVQLNNQTYQGLTPEQTGERLLPFIVED